MYINDSRVNFQVDSGATCNVISVSKLKDVLHCGPMVKKNKVDVKLKVFNNNEMKSLGTIKLLCVRKDNQYNLKFHVVKEVVPSIIGLKDAERLKFIKVLENDIDSFKPLYINLINDKEHNSVDGIASVDEDSNVVLNKELILNKYADIFDGLGNLGSPCKIDLDTTIKPVVHAPRRVPFSLRKKLKAQLTEMEGTIIEKVTEPTDWVSSMVVVTKPNTNELRICIDPTDLNQAIKRPHYPLPTIEEILPHLGNARIFSVLDAKSGFWQVSLDEQSSYLTTFNTPYGRYRWKRMPFGISSAPEEYQRRMNEALQNLNGVVVIADDILVYGEGSNDKEALINHDTNLCKLLQRCREENIKRNKDKLKLHLSEVTYIGHLLTNHGLQPDPKKVDAISNLKPPADVKALKRFLGMVNYLAKFLPNLSDMTQPLRNLEKKNVEWEWNSCHEVAFERLKKAIAEAPVLKYFDSSADVTLQCDASMSGIGTVLLQNGQPVAYASKALTDIEQRYSQIEKELLAIVYAASHFEQYIYGKETKIETDHKPLESIFKKPLLKCPKRLQRMLLQLQRYNLQVRYKPGIKLYIADTLSRDYLPNTKLHLDNSEILLMLENISTLDMSEDVSITDERLEDIRLKTRVDPELQVLKETILKGWPTHYKNVPECIRSYFSYRDELSADNDLIFRGSCIVVPKSLRSYMIKQIHYAHTGIESTIRYGRDILFWPGMSADLKTYVSNCNICNKYCLKNVKESLKSHVFPERPWVKVGMDIFTIGKQNYLILVDYYSSYFEVNSLENLLTNTVIDKVRGHFARYGIPNTVVSDCGPQFTSSEFKEFAKKWSFRHIKSSPYHHQSNGKAENAVKIAKSLLIKAKEDGKDPLLSLLEWRNTPTEGFNCSPAQRFYGRRTRSQLPACAELYKQKIIANVPQIQSHKLRKQSFYYNKGSKDLKNLNPGDHVRVQPDPGKKEWTPGVVIEELSPRKYKVKMKGSTYVRNRKYLKATGKKFIDQNDNCPLSVLSPNENPELSNKEQTTFANLSVPRTRSGRLVKKPSYLQDYI